MPATRDTQGVAHLLELTVAPKTLVEATAARGPARGPTRTGTREAALAATLAPPRDRVAARTPATRSDREAALAAVVVTTSTATTISAMKEE